MTMIDLPPLPADYRPMFPYFGGKRTVARHIWAALGDVKNYVEPFFGSGAALFLRPNGAGHTETVNDLNGFVANFWRAIQADPDGLAAAMGWPVNEIDLESRHKWLVCECSVESAEALDAAGKTVGLAAWLRAHGGPCREFVQRLKDNPNYYDLERAAWWCWGLCAWIGRGWCDDNAAWHGPDDSRNRGTGINVADAEWGGKRPHLGCNGSGVHAVTRRDNLVAECRRFADRLRRVRVCCGDWSRVCSPAVTHSHGLTGVFLDPPYANTANRAGAIYATDSLSVAHDVREWAIAQGQRDDMRIVLAGYEGEHPMPDGWRVIAWKSHGGYVYKSPQPDSQGKVNQHRERLWMSPACVGAGEPTLLGAAQ